MNISFFHVWEKLSRFQLACIGCYILHSPFFRRSHKNCACHTQELNDRILLPLFVRMFVENNRWHVLGTQFTFYSIYTYMADVLLEYWLVYPCCSANIYFSLMCELHVTWCLNSFSITVTKQHGQYNLQKEDFIRGLSLHRYRSLSQSWWGRWHCKSSLELTFLSKNMKQK